ncbi:hypothetical protein CPAV1605_716 [seawater metagenome]|uniref:Uncharacterized protein n=1 Tax=seawater metagenome TaxID=1561972 RepID=A0A5E8CIF6_9ZZZZ
MALTFPPLTKATVDAINFSEIYTNSDNNNLNFDLLYNNRELLIELPELKIEALEHNIDSYYLICEILDEESFDFLQLLNSKIIKHLSKKSKKWFRKKICFDISDIYNSNLLLPKNFTGYPRIKIRIPVKKGNILSKFFDSKGMRVSINDVKQHDEIGIILSLNSIIFNQMVFNFDITLYQSRKINTSTEMNLLTDSESDNEIILSEEKALFE